MAKKSKQEEKFNYRESVRSLKENGPKNLYLIWGPEDYLADQFFAEIKKLCVTDEGDDFSYRKHPPFPLHHSVQVWQWL